MGLVCRPTTTQRLVQPVLDLPQQIEVPQVPQVSQQAPQVPQVPEVPQVSDVPEVSQLVQPDLLRLALPL